MSKPKRILKPEKYPLLSKKRNQFIDKITRISTPKFPETFTINDGYISAIKRKQFGYPDIEYFESDVIIKSHFGWANIFVMMTNDDLYEIAKKSYDRRHLKFFKSIVEYGNTHFRYSWESYFQFKGADLAIFQIKGMNNEYHTTRLLAPLEENASLFFNF